MGKVDDHLIFWSTMLAVIFFHTYFCDENKILSVL